MLEAALIAHAWRTPLGHDVDAVMHRLMAGERACRHDHHFSTGAFECALGAPVPGKPPPSRHARFLQPIALWALEAGRAAFRAADITASSERVGVFTAIGGLLPDWDGVMDAMARQELDGARAWERGLSSLHPFWMLRYLSNNAQALLAADIGARGEGMAFGGATAAVQALGSAISALAEGAIDVAVVVAYDSLLDPVHLMDLSRRGVCSRAATPSEVVAPYDAGAAGLVPGEAAAAVVLERPKRCDALALVSVAEAADGRDGQPARSTLSHALQQIAAGATLVDGAARAQVALDDEERTVIGEHAQAMLTACSSAFGEVGAAKPLLQLIALSRMLALGRIIPVAGSREATPGVATIAAPLDARIALAIATGSPGAVGVVRVTRAE